MTAPSVTRALSEGLVDLARQPLAESAAYAAERSLLNVVATTVGAARSDAIDAYLAYAARTGQSGATSVLGRPERLAPIAAALAAGVAAHYDDFDDTHLETVIHPAAVGLGALIATNATTHVTGEQALRAFALGIEGQLRIGAAISPSHYDLGWHITGTCGVLGAAITSGLLAGLDARQLEATIGVAATMTIGVREAFGTMTKPYHPGRAAANGVLAVRLVRAGMQGPDGVLEASGGLSDVLTHAVDPDRFTAGLGKHWELDANTFKPYPCGIVSHPAIAAASALHVRVPDTAAIERVEIRCHPLVAELTGNPDPENGLAARFSTIHGVCAGLADGLVGLTQYTDDRVRADDLIALRSSANLRVDAAMARDAATVIVTTSDGRTLEEHVDHAPGSLARPLTDDELLDKVRSLVEPVLPGRTDRIHAAVQRLRDASNLAELLDATNPETNP